MSVAYTKKIFKVFEQINMQCFLSKPIHAQVHMQTIRRVPSIFEGCPVLLKTVDQLPNLSRCKVIGPFEEKNPIKVFRYAFVWLPIRNHLRQCILPTNLSSFGWSEWYYWCSYMCTSWSDPFPRSLSLVHWILTMKNKNLYSISVGYICEDDFSRASCWFALWEANLCRRDKIRKTPGPRIFLNKTVSLELWMV